MPVHEIRPHRSSTKGASFWYCNRREGPVLAACEMPLPARALRVPWLPACGKFGTRPAAFVAILEQTELQAHRPPQSRASMRMASCLGRWSMAATALAAVRSLGPAPEHTTANMQQGHIPLTWSMRKHGVGAQHMHMGVRPHNSQHAAGEQSTCLCAAQNMPQVCPQATWRGRCSNTCALLQARPSPLASPPPPTHTHSFRGRLNLMPRPCQLPPPPTNPHTHHRPAY
jgi:hypothetical protein